MSDINGSGYGDSHNWQRGDSLQWGNMGLPSSAAQTKYTCKDCGESFCHHYNITPNIFQAMEDSGISDVCPKTLDKAEADK